MITINSSFGFLKIAIKNNQDSYLLFEQIGIFNEQRRVFRYKKHFKTLWVFCIGCAGYS